MTAGNGSLHADIAVPPPDGASRVVDLLRQVGVLSDLQIRHASRVQAKLETPHTLLQVLQKLGAVDCEKIAAAVRAHPDAIDLATLLTALGHIEEADLRALVAAGEPGKDTATLD